MSDRCATIALLDYVVGVASDRRVRSGWAAAFRAVLRETLHAVKWVSALGAGRKLERQVVYSQPQ